MNFFSLKEKNDMSASYVSCMMCFSLIALFVTKRHKILGRSTLEREPHDYNLIMRIKWECILILKTNRILSYLEHHYFLGFFVSHKDS